MEVNCLELGTKEEEEEAFRKILQDGDKKEAHTLKLKPLPNHLKYAILDQDDTYHIIIKIWCINNTQSASR